MKCIPFIIDHLWDQARLDRWLRHHFPVLPHSFFAKAIRKKLLHLDNQPVTSVSQRLQKGSCLAIPEFLQARWQEESSRDISPQKPRVLSPQEIKKFQSWILYQDDFLMALNKPCGLAAQGGTGLRRSIDDYAQLWAQDQSCPRPLLAHRLDRGTSGVLLLARHRVAALWLTQQFAQRTSKKTYWAIVSTQDPWSLTKTGVIRTFLQDYPSSSRTTLAAEDVSGQAITSYIYQQGKFCPHTRLWYHWLVLHPLTGRMHQLRIHCASNLAAPILGDTDYGPPKRICPFNVTLPKHTLLLHAHSLDIPLPCGKNFAIQAPPPHPFQQVLRVLTSQ